MIWPAEWAPQRAVWMGWPSDPSLWADDLEPARAEAAALARALSPAVGLRLVASGEEAAEAAARAAPGVEIVSMPMGDIWLRDTGPIFTGPSRAVAFCFNGWGGKYRLAGDETVAERLAEASGAVLERLAPVLEGGALDGDGDGRLVTTEQCLLNPNRNPGLDRCDLEEVLKEALGVHEVIWLGEGLAGDHTDGHVDNLARFVGPGRLALPLAADSSDPNAAAFADARARARAAGLELVDMPSAGRIEVDGELRPVSYMNFLVSNGIVAVPHYGLPTDQQAIAALARAFPRHRVVGLRSDHLLSGGGSFHCMTQQVPQ